LLSPGRRRPAPAAASGKRGRGGIFFISTKKKIGQGFEESNSGFGEPASGPGAGVGDAALQMKEGVQTH